MKKFMLTLLAALALSGISVVAADVLQPEEQAPLGWYDWSKQKVQAAGQTVGHYVPLKPYLQNFGQQVGQYTPRVKASVSAGFDAGIEGALGVYNKTNQLYQAYMPEQLQQAGRAIGDYMPSQIPQGWYDWFDRSKQNLQNFGQQVGHYAPIAREGLSAGFNGLINNMPPVQYWPGIGTGLMGSMLGLTYLRNPSSDDLKALVDFGVMEAAKKGGLGGLEGIMQIFAAQDYVNARTNAAKKYAPYLLGTSAALLAAPYLYGKYKPQLEQQKWYRQAKQKFQQAAHYMPSWHYWPAVAAGSLAALNAGTNIAKYGNPLADFAHWDWRLRAAAAGAGPLIAAGYGLKRLENRIRGRSNEGTNYAYYAPGIIAGLYPLLFTAAAGGLYGSGLIDFNSIKPGDKYYSLLDNAGWAMVPSHFSSPALLAAGHLAHQYFNRPVQASVVPVSSEPIEETQWINMPPAEPGLDPNVYHDPFNHPRVEGSPWRLWPDDEMEAHYAELRDAVFAKMGPAFADAFNLKYPRSSVEAVKELALHIDAITPWQESYPPQATATIGAKRIALGGDIANIIYDMRNN